MALSDQQVIEQMDDVEMLRRPHLWPGPDGIVFLQKRGGMSSNYSDVNAGLGFIHPSHPLTVALGNVLVQPEMPRELVKYESPEAIVADGWMVD